MGFYRFFAVFSLFIPSLALANWTLPADAINNTGDFASCTFDGSSTVTCANAVNLNATNATLTLTQDLTLIINGGLNTPDAITINPNNSYNLVIDLGANSFNTNGNNATINADIIAGSISINGVETVVNGDLMSSGGININSGPLVNGNVTASGSISNNSVIEGKVTTGGSFTNNSGAVVSGRVEAAGTVMNNGTVTSNIDAAGSVTNNSGAIAGSINSDASVVNNGTVLGYINAPVISNNGSAPYTCDINSNLGPCAGAQDPEFDYCSEVTLLTTYGVVGSGGFTFGNGSEINGNTIDGTGNTPTPIGQVDTVDLEYPPLDPLIFPNFSGGSSLDISKNNDPNDIPPGTYSTIDVAGGQNGNFLGGTYYIDTLEVGAKGSGTGITLGPGDYFIRDIIFHSGIYVNTTGGGPARLFIEGSIGQSNANQLELNSSGSAGNLQIYLYEGATISLGNGNMGANKETLNFNGTIYGPFPDNNITLGNNNTLQGSILTAGTIDVGTDTVFNYSPEVQAEVTTSLGCAPVDAEVHHYRILHPQVLVSCYAASVEVIACADEICSATYDDPVTVTVSSSDADSTWQGGNLDSTTNADVNLLFSNGSGLSGLRNTNGGTANLALSNASPTAVDATQCFDSSGTTATSCDVVFNTAGLIITDTDGVSPLPATFAGIGASADSAGLSLPAALRAVQTNTTTGACEARLTGTHTVNLGMQCLNPGTCQAGQSFTVNNQAIGLNAAGNTTNTSSLSLTFDANGRVATDLQLRYSDVGQVRLFASLPLTEAPAAPDPTINDPDVELVGTSINDFVVKPYRLVTRALDDANNLWTSTLASGPGFKAAGEPFSMVIQSLNTANEPTPNFGLESSSAAVQVQFDSMAYPTPAAAGSDASKLTLSNSFTIDSNYAGAKRTTGAIWNEAGTVNLRARLLGDNYLGAGDAFERPPSPVGRFYPHRFAVAPGSDLVSNACSAFTYMGQNAIAVDYIVQALNLGGNVTRNYGLNYSGTAVVELVAAHTSPIDEATDEFDQRLAPFTQSTWVDGELTFSNSSIAFARRSDELPDGPYPNLRIGLQATGDIDSRNFASSDLSLVSQRGDAVPIGGALNLRYGRMVLENTYGPENEPLPVVMRAEYWDGSRFVLNDLDSCTATTATSLNILENPSALTTTGAGVDSDLLTGELLPDSLYWTPPSPTATGEFLFEYQTDSWLEYPWLDENGDSHRFPRATAGFGQYRGNDRVIFWMERQ